MTGAEHAQEGSLPVEANSAALNQLARLFEDLTPAGTLRVILQQIPLREDDREAGVHEVLEAVADVGGNLVVIPLREQVRGHAEHSRTLDLALTRLRADLVTVGAPTAETLELWIDADGERRVLVTRGLALTPQQLCELPSPEALHDGAHHVTYDAPALDELRDRMRPPGPGPMGRALDWFRGLWNS